MNSAFSEIPWHFCIDEGRNKKLICDHLTAISQYIGMAIMPIKQTENKNVIFTIIPNQKSFPGILLKQIMEKANRIFDVPVQYNIVDKTDQTKNSINNTISLKSHL